MDMLSFLETAADEENERLEYMLHEISDLSSDEDSPTRNDGGHRRNMANGTSSQLASDFVYGMVLLPISCLDATVDQLWARQPLASLSQPWS